MVDIGNTHFPFNPPLNNRSESISAAQKIVPSILGVPIWSKVKTGSGIPVLSSSKHCTLLTAFSTGQMLMPVCF
jgi:hypothetical protein